MAVLTKTITGVVAGEVYPREIAAGQECPAELEDAARTLGALADGEAPARKAARRVPETKGA